MLQITKRSIKIGKGGSKYFRPKNSFSSNNEKMVTNKLFTRKISNIKNYYWYLLLNVIF